MYVCTINSKKLGITFDYFDSERVLSKNKCKYYLTPKRFAKIESWMIQNFIMDITKEQLDFILKQGWIGEYSNKLQSN